MYIVGFVQQKDPLKLKTGGFVDIKLLKREYVLVIVMCSYTLDFLCVMCTSIHH